MGPFLPEPRQPWGSKGQGDPDPDPNRNPRGCPVYPGPLVSFSLGKPVARSDFCQDYDPPPPPGQMDPFGHKMKGYERAWFLSLPRASRRGCRLLPAAPSWEEYLSFFRLCWCWAQDDSDQLTWCGGLASMSRGTCSTFKRLYTGLRSTPHA